MSLCDAPTESYIITGVTIPLSLSRRTRHDQGSEYTMVFTTLAHTQGEGNIKGVCSRLGVTGSRIKMSPIPATNKEKFFLGGPRLSGSLMWCSQLSLSEGI